MSPEDIQILREYQRKGLNYELNQSLNGNSGVQNQSTHSKVAKLKNIIDRGPELPVGLTLYRVTPLYPGEKVLEAGETSAFRGFASTSVNRQGPQSIFIAEFPLEDPAEPGKRFVGKVIEYEIVIASNGIHGISLGHLDRFTPDNTIVFDPENEILLPPGLTFKVIKAEKLPQLFTHLHDRFEYFHYVVEATETH